jgi:phosphate transport system substrate-binding protein
MRLLAIAGLLLMQGAGLSMTCTGGDTMQGLAERWAAGYGHVTVGHDTRLSAEGFALFLAGQIDCVTYVREPFVSELRAYRNRYGRPPLVLKVAGGSYDTKSGTHAIAIYVNQANPLSRLTMAQLEGLFSGRITKWRELGAANDQPIHFYGMLRSRDSGNPPGIVNFLEDRILRGESVGADIREQIDKPGETALEAIVHRVAEDPLGIGFSGFAYAAPGAKTLALGDSEKGPFYAGTREEVASRAYPLSRYIYLMVPPDMSPERRGFLRYVLSDAGQKAIEGDPMGFLPLTPAERTAARAQLEQY